MDQRAKQRRLRSFEQRCRERGTPFTVQRRAILGAVLDHGDHPAADEVHQMVVSRIPGVSRTTVYRTLETLVEMRLLTKAWHSGSAVRYDTCIERHHHLVCEHCDHIIDISDKKLDALSVPNTSRLGFKVSDFGVQFRGTCRRCRDREEEE